VHNLAASPREISFEVGIEGEQGELLVNLLSEEHSRADVKGRHCFLLEAYGYRWYRVGGLDYLLKRSDVQSFVDARPVASTGRIAALVRNRSRSVRLTL
jgi:maltose alpha-D-glucosyltransferase/alpha-amylase